MSAHYENLALNATSSNRPLEMRHGVNGRYPRGDLIQFFPASSHSCDALSIRGVFEPIGSKGWNTARIGGFWRELQWNDSKAPRVNAKDIAI